MTVATMKTRVPTAAKKKKASPGAPKKRSYESRLRKEQAESTQRQIVEAARELLKAVRPEDLSYAALADRTGIAQRTIYRHFPDRKELFVQVARAHITRFLGDGMRLGRDLPGKAANVAALYRMFSEEPGSYRLMFAVPSRSQGGVQGMIEEIVEDVIAPVPADQRPTVMGAAEVCVSPYFWDILHSHFDVPHERISRAAIVMLSLLLDAVERDPGLFDPARPPPPRFRPKPERAGSGSTPPSAGEHARTRRGR